MRKFISLLVASVLLISLFAVAVSAEGNQVAVISGGTTTEYADYKDGFKAAKAGDTVKLLTDITLYGNQSLDVAAGTDLTVDGNGHSIYSPYNCFYCVSTTADKRTKLTLRNLTVDSTQNSGKSAVQLNGYVDLLIEGCTLKTSNDGVETKMAYNVVTIKNSSIYSTSRWGVKATNANTYILENTKIESSGGACIEVLKGNNPGADVTLTNCDFTGTGNFALWLHEKTKVTINGGSYKTVGNANKPAAVYIEDNDVELTIKDGTFSCDTVSAITVKGASTVNIEGGTFNYTGAGAGSALVASAGTVNITGGTFVSNGTDAVINVTGADANVTITRATCTYNGSAAVPAYANNGKTVESFPAGATTVTIPVPPETEPETTTAEPEVTTSEPEVTTSGTEVTTAGSEVSATGSVVTTSTPEATTAKPEVTTSAPAPSTGENTQMLFVICGGVFLALAAVIVVKIREKN
ncbi:MAG: right-handed parallel beta-helix repeat-containing protein [Clostridiales bacterium]|nr:right-handed parallel beta-helix repeat-containing protein [Clostridiales bacterium]